MKLLLDTHVWLWMLLDPARLSRATARELRAQKNELWLSPISIWEASLLVEAKRIRIKGSAQAWVERLVSGASTSGTSLTSRWSRHR